MCRLLLFVPPNVIHTSVLHSRDLILSLFLEEIHPEHHQALLLTSFSCDPSQSSISRKGDQEKNNDSTDHIHQLENTTTVWRHKPEDRTKSNKML